MTVKEAIEFLQKYYKPTDHVAMHLWNTDDVLDTASGQLCGCDKEIELTASEAEEIIDDIHHYIDSEYGVTWETLRCYVQDYDRNRNY